MQPLTRSRPRARFFGGGTGSAASTLGPTLDLVFVPPATDPLAPNLQSQTLDLNFISEAYQVAEQYVVWE
jgi:hypothetical protein